MYIKILEPCFATVDNKILRKLEKNQIIELRQSVACKLLTEGKAIQATGFETSMMLLDKIQDSLDNMDVMYAQIRRVI